MAGFAVKLRLILARPEVWIGRDARGGDSKVGQLETDFLEHFTTREKVECRGLNSEVYTYMISIYILIFMRSLVCKIHEN